MNGRKWYRCPCGQGLAVSGSEWGQAVLAQWQRVHAAHSDEQTPNREVGSAS